MFYFLLPLLSAISVDAAINLNCDAVLQAQVEVLVLHPLHDSVNSSVSAGERLQKLHQSLQLTFENAKVSLVSHSRECPQFFDPNSSNKTVIGADEGCLVVYASQDKPVETETAFEDSIAAFKSDLEVGRPDERKAPLITTPSVVARSLDILLAMGGRRNELPLTKQVVVVFADANSKSPVDSVTATAIKHSGDVDWRSRYPVQRIASEIAREDTTFIVFALGQEPFDQWREVQKNVSSENIWVLRQNASAPFDGVAAAEIVGQQLCLAAQTASFPLNRYRDFDKVGTASEYKALAEYFTNAWEAGMPEGPGVSVEDLAQQSNFSLEKYGYDVATDSFATDPAAEITRLCLESNQRFRDSSFDLSTKGYEKHHRLPTYAKRRFNVVLEMGAPIWPENGPEAFHFNQGGLGDCDFLARLGALVTHGEARLDVKDSIYPPVYNPAGVYSFLIYSDAHPEGRYYLIDDSIPDARIGGTAPAYAQYEWYKLFEKMYLKRTHGDVIHSNRIVMRDFNHHFYYNVRLHQHERYKTFWEDATTNRTHPITGIFSAYGDATGPVVPVRGHVSSIIDLQTIIGYKFVVTHNPWNYNTRLTTLQEVHPDLYRLISSTKEYEHFTKRFKEKYVAWLLLEDFINTTGNVQVMDRVKNAIDHTGKFPIPSGAIDHAAIFSLALSIFPLFS